MAGFKSWNRWSREYRRSRGGFTLLEVLIAFAILAVAMTALMQAFSQGLRGLEVAEDYATAIMLARSKMAEVGPAEDVVSDPLHPYTQRLIQSVPTLKGNGAEADSEAQGLRASELPSPTAPPPGCRYHPRCPLAEDRCRSEEPLLREIGPQSGRFAACHLI